MGDRKQNHRIEMSARRQRQNDRVGAARSMPARRNDPHFGHAHARENARRLRQMARGAA